MELRRRTDATTARLWLLTVALLASQAFISRRCFRRALAQLRPPPAWDALSTSSLAVVGALMLRRHERAHSRPTFLVLRDPACDPIHSGLLGLLAAVPSCTSSFRGRRFIAGGPAQGGCAAALHAPTPEEGHGRPEHESVRDHVLVAVGRPSGACRPVSRTFPPEYRIRFGSRPRGWQCRMER